MSHKRKIEELEDVEEPQTKKIKHGGDTGKTILILVATNAILPNFFLDVSIAITNSSLKDNAFSLSSLPPEILSHHILKFFDFRDWLKLVVVCKQWQLAAQQSTLNKQLVYRRSQKGKEPVVCSILSRYRVNTLVIEASIRFQALQTLVGSSPSLTTLVTDSGSIRHLYSGDATATICQITILSTRKLNLLTSFPNVTKLRLLSRFNAHSNDWVESIDESNLEGCNFPSVQELEINVERQELEYFEAIKRAFPSLTKLYLNYNGNNKTPKIMEEISKQLKITIVHHNPHLSPDVNDFSLASISYHDYFNGFGRTPLQKLLDQNKSEFSKTCQELLNKYTNKQYEKDLYNREPQFNFPLRCPVFEPKSPKTSSRYLTKDLLFAVVQSGYIDYWRAIGSSTLSLCTKEEMIELLHLSVNYMPPTHHAVKSIPTILGTIDELALSDVVETIGSDVFKTIATLRSKQGDTLLHCYAETSDSFKEGDFEQLATVIDIKATNMNDENAATVAFSYRHWSIWTQLVTNGAPVQGEEYDCDLLQLFLIDTVLRGTVPLSILQVFDQPRLQELLWQLVPTDNDDEVPRYEEVFDELVRLGANPKDKGDNNPLVCLIAANGRIEKRWTLIQKYELDINEFDNNGETPLMISMKRCLTQQAEYLLTNGANPNIRTTDADGRIRYAVFLLNEVRNTESQLFTDLLKRYKADFAVEDELGNTVVNRAASEVRFNKHVFPLVSLDKPNHQGYTPLANAIVEKRANLIEELITAGADPNLRVGHLLRPLLTLALESGNKDIVKSLLSCRKIDIKNRDRGNRSFVYYLLKAKLWFYSEIFDECDSSLVALLKDHYNTPENITFIKHEVNSVLTTPELSHFKTRLMCIALTSIEHITFLIDVIGVDINIEDNNSDTFLTLVGDGNKSKVVEFLLARGVNVNHQNKQGNTALMLAIENNITINNESRGGRNEKNDDEHEEDTEFDLKKELIKAGASLTIENMWGISPLEADPSLKS